MMQESGGNYVDLMQAAEGPYNTKYPKIPNGITDPDYSIACGIQELKLNFTEAGVKDGNDSQNINLGLQAYNFGTGYISFAKSNGGYSLENAKEFSAKEAVIYGYSNYGDVNYVPHVLRYYNVTNIATGSGDLGNIVSIAQQQEGKPYVWGAAGPSSFDCSGLVYYCYVNSGYKIQRETAQDYYNMSTKTTTPVAGDLVFFGTPGNIYHIGIYSGNGQMINAPKTGDVVKVASVSRSDFAGYGHLNK
jgi:cell wall-associated NlpC family hydrolase